MTFLTLTEVWYILLLDLIFFSGNLFLVTLNVYLQEDNPGKEDCGRGEQGAGEVDPRYQRPSSIQTKPNSAV